MTFLVFKHIPPLLPRAVASTAPISCRVFVVVGSRPGIPACSAPSLVPRLPTATTLSSALAATTTAPFSKPALQRVVSFWQLIHLIFRSLHLARDEVAKDLIQLRGHDYVGGELPPELVKAERDAK